jgi:hypothetical protein
MANSADIASLATDHRWLESNPLAQWMLRTESRSRGKFDLTPIQAQAVLIKMIIIKHIDLPFALNHFSWLQAVDKIDREN